MQILSGSRALQGSVPRVQAIGTPPGGEVLKDAKQLFHDPTDFSIIDALPCGPPLLQRWPLCQPLYQEKAPLILPIVQIIWNIWVRELPQGVGLALEELKLLPCLQAAECQLLDSDGVPFLHVHGLVCRTACTIAKLALYSVSAHDNFTWCAVCRCLVMLVTTAMLNLMAMIRTAFKLKMNSNDLE
jgi:hypothetical protein